MNKEEFIKRYGEAAWEKQLEQMRAYYNAHREEENARSKKWREENSEEVIANGQEQCRRDGKYYDKHLIYEQNGIQGERNRIRSKHRRDYKPYKDIIAPDSQIHHEWIPKTDEYRGVALVEAEQHMHGIVDVIEILDGEITLLTEEEIKKGEKREKESLQAG